MDPIGMQNRDKGQSEGNTVTSPTAFLLDASAERFLFN